MAEPNADELARNRWLVIQALRSAGVAMVVVGVMIVEQVIPAPPVVGYVLALVGVIDVFLVPMLLARRWRTPRE